MRTIEELARHVTDLAAAFHVRLKVDGKMAPDAAMASRSLDNLHQEVIISPVIDETTYAAALHELGHLVAPMGMLHAELTLQMRTMKKPSTLRDVLLQLEMENAAWDWAQHYALEWTPLMLSVKKMTLGSYERMARRYLGGGVPR